MATVFKKVFMITAKLLLKSSQQSPVLLYRLRLLEPLYFKVFSLMTMWTCSVDFYYLSSI